MSIIISKINRDPSSYLMPVQVTNVLRLKTVSNGDVLINIRDIIMVKSLGVDRAIVTVRSVGTLTVVANFASLQRAIVEKGLEIKDDSVIDMYDYCSDQG